MAPKQKDERTALCQSFGTHNGQRFTVTMTAPILGARFRNGVGSWNKSIGFARIGAAPKVRAQIAGFIVPATFTVTGLDRVIRFTTKLRATDKRDSTIQIGYIVVEDGTTHLDDGAIPKPSTLLRAALKATSCVIEQTPQSKRTGGTLIGVMSRASRDDISNASGNPIKERTGGRAAIFDDSELLNCAYWYKQLPPKSQRVGVGTREWIGGQTNTPSGTVGRQIKAARDAGHLPKPKKKRDK